MSSLRYREEGRLLHLDGLAQSGLIASSVPGGWRVGNASRRTIWERRHHKVLIARVAGQVQSCVSDGQVATIEGIAGCCGQELSRVRVFSFVSTWK